MIDAETLEKLQKASLQDRIAVIEMLVQSLKGDIKPDAVLSPEATTRLQRPAFGFMKDTGKILGDIVAPVLPENTWEALQ